MFKFENCTCYVVRPNNKTLVDYITIGIRKKDDQLFATKIPTIMETQLLGLTDLTKWSDEQLVACAIIMSHGTIVKEREHV